MDFNKEEYEKKLKEELGEVYELLSLLLKCNISLPPELKGRLTKYLNKRSRAINFKLNPISEDK